MGPGGTRQHPTGVRGIMQITEDHSGTLGVGGLDAARMSSLREHCARARGQAPPPPRAFMSLIARGWHSPRSTSASATSRSSTSWPGEAEARSGPLERRQEGAAAARASPSNYPASETGLPKGGCRWPSSTACAGITTCCSRMRRRTGRVSVHSPPPPGRRRRVPETESNNNCKWGPYIGGFVPPPTHGSRYLTLTALEIVLGVDNIIFISILVGRLPPEQRARARMIGLGLAMVMRIALLLSLAWMMPLAKHRCSRSSARAFPDADLILLFGGIAPAREVRDRDPQLARGRGHGCPRRAPPGRLLRHAPAEQGMGQHAHPCARDRPVLPHRGDYVPADAPQSWLSPTTRSAPMQLRDTSLALAIDPGLVRTERLLGRHEARPRRRGLRRSASGVR